MKIIIITQNEKFFLNKLYEEFLKNLPPNFSIKAIILPQSPFGKKRNIIIEIKDTIKVFGLRFFIIYSFRFIKAIIKKETVKDVFIKNKIPVNNLSGSINCKISLDRIKKQKPDIILSIAANQIFKSELLSIPKYGTLNLHNGDLPNYRGLMPIFWALKNNDEKIGITLFSVDSGIDTGPIVGKIYYIIKERNLNRVISDTRLLGARLILNVINSIGDEPINFNSDQKKLKGSYFGFPSRKDVQEFKNNGNKLI